MICMKCGKREATEQILTIHDTLVVAGSPNAGNARSEHRYEDWCHKCAERLRKRVASQPEVKFVQQQRAAGVPFDVIQKELERRFSERLRPRWWHALAFWRW